MSLFQYIVKDEHNESRDTTIARHVMKIHLNREQAAVEGEMSIEMLKKYIAYTRAKCGPRWVSQKYMLS